jgi:ADP-ribose pyrophosphatase YjhB (NUDIX family)
MTPPDPHHPAASPVPTGLERFVGPDGVVRRVRLAAYGWCTDGDRVLLCRISDRGPGGGHWTLPGGRLDFGEQPAAGVIRELREETGLEGAVDALLGVRSAVLEPAETISGHRIQAVGLLYAVTITGGSLRDEADGSTDLARWVPLADVDALPLVGLVTWALGVVRAG